MKKCMLIVLITVFALVSVGAFCSADSRRGVTNTSKKGSLLVFPLIKVGLDPDDGNDTIITLSNDYYARVNLFCQYTTPDGCFCDDGFDIALTAYQTIAFSAKTGYGVDNATSISKFDIAPGAFPTGQRIGELRCWAVASKFGREPMSWNHLSGTATIHEGTNQTWQYSAWRFAVGYEVPRGSIVLDASGEASKTLRLTGMPDAYDACPESLIFNFVKQVQQPDVEDYGPLADNRLTLVPCKQDCVTGGSTTVRARFSRYDEAENSLYTQACIDCTTEEEAFYDQSLSGKVANPSIFSTGLKVGGSGMAIVENFPGSGADCGEQYGVPLLGVISNTFSSPDGPVAGETLTVLGRGQPELTIRNGGGNIIKSGIEVIMRYE